MEIEGENVDMSGCSGGKISWAVVVTLTIPKYFMQTGGVRESVLYGVEKYCTYRRRFIRFDLTLVR